MLIKYEKKIDILNIMNKESLDAVKDHNNLKKQFGQMPVLQKWVLLSDLCIGDHDYPAQIVDPSIFIGNNGGPSNGGGAPAPSASVNNGSDVGLPAAAPAATNRPRTSNSRANAPSSRSRASANANSNRSRVSSSAMVSGIRKNSEKHFQQGVD